MRRRCKYIDADGDTVFGVCHGFGFKAWTHGGGASIGSFPPGQESYAVAIVEHESDGTISQVDVERMTMLESDEPTPEQRYQQLEWVAMKLYRYIKNDADQSWSPAKEKVAENFKEQLEALGVSLDD